jgi:hypothetical protein
MQDDECGLGGLGAAWQIRFVAPPHILVILTL